MSPLAIRFFFIEARRPTASTARDSGPDDKDFSDNDGLSTDWQVRTNNVVRVEDNLLGQLQERIKLCRVLFERPMLAALSLPITANVSGDFVGPMDEDQHGPIAAADATKDLGVVSDAGRSDN